MNYCSLELHVGHSPEHCIDIEGVDGTVVTACMKCLLKLVLAGAGTADPIATEYLSTSPPLQLPPFRCDVSCPFLEQPKAMGGATSDRGLCTMLHDEVTVLHPACNTTDWRKRIAAEVGLLD